MTRSFILGILNANGYQYGSVRANGDGGYTERHPLLNSWYDDNVFSCERCGEYELLDNGNTVAARNCDEAWCVSCTGNHAIYCEYGERCFATRFHSFAEVDGYGTVCVTYYSDTFMYHDRTGEYYHEDDYPGDDDDDDENGLDEYHDNHTIHTVPAGYIGCELELLAKNDVPECADVVRSCGCYAERDGSLDSDGFEVISPKPLPYERYLTGDTHIQNAMRDLRSMALGHDAGTGYGLHISICVDGWNGLRRTRFARLWSELSGIVPVVARRDYTTYCSKASWPDAKKVTVSKGGYIDRYEACRFEAIRAEVRVFRSTMNPVTFLACIQLVKAVYEFSAVCGLNSSESEFLQWLRYEPYPVLKRYLNSKGYSLPVSKVQNEEVSVCA